MKKLLLSVCLLGIAMHTLQAQTESGRVRYSLDAQWKFHEGDIPMPEIKGHRASYQNAKAGKSWGAAAPDYDDSQWKEVDLPHDWAVCQPFDPEANLSQGYRQRGIGWYRRTFNLPTTEKDNHFELQFDGIATYAQIWVNGTLLHRNWCGYTSAYIDITPYLKFGNVKNTIAVRVDANSMEGWWYEGAGIYRHTYLLKRPATHIQTDGVWANPVKKSDKQWILPIETELLNAGRTDTKVMVKHTLYDKEHKIIGIATTNTSLNSLCKGVTKASITVNNPQLWSVDQPYLYTVKTELTTHEGKHIDEVKTTCGFRTFRFNADKGFFLNDQPLKIKGVCNHQDHAGVGVALPDALWEFRIRKLKEMGVNAYRCAHNPPSKELLAVCDSMGILVMDENRVFNTSPEYVRQLQWLVKRDRNHPSVFLWSVFNEEPMQGTENGYEMVRRMRHEVELLDTTRYVTAAMNGGLFSPLCVAHAVEVVGFNYQDRQYDRFHKTYPTKMLLSSEDTSAFGVRGEYTNDDSKNIIDDYDSQSANWGLTHRKAWKAIDQRPFMAGGFVWTGFDYRGEPTPHQWPSVSSFFGIMDLCGFPKTSYYIHQAHWIKEKAVMHIAPHWSWPIEYTNRKIQVMTLTNADRVVLKLNGKQIGSADVDKYMMNTFEVPYQPGKLEAIGYKDGKRYAYHCVETTGKPQNIRLTPYRHTLQANGCDCTPVSVELTDSKGRHIPTANQMVKFEISGPGKIIGLGNGNPNSHEAEKGNHRSLFNGYAQVIVQHHGKQSDMSRQPIILTAHIEGMQSQSIHINLTKATQAQPTLAPAQPTQQITRWHISPDYPRRPHVTERIAENDMNSWEPTTLENNLLTKTNGYRIYRAIIPPGTAPKKQNRTLHFQRIVGKAEIWIEDSCVVRKKEKSAKEVKVSCPSSSSPKELRILFERTQKQEQEMVGLHGIVELN